MKSNLRIGSLVGLLLVSAVLGLLWNQAYPGGLSWRLLQLSLPDGSRRSAWQPVSTDSAFALWIRREVCFVDLRSPEDFRLDHIPGALNKPFLSFFRNPEVVTDDRPVMVYDFEAHSERSVLLVQAFRRAGAEAFFLRNGYRDWLAYGFPREAAEVR